MDWRDRAARLDEGPRAVLPDREHRPGDPADRGCEGRAAAVRSSTLPLKWAIESGQDAGV